MEAFFCAFFSAERNFGASSAVSLGSARNSSEFGVLVGALAVAGSSGAGAALATGGVSTRPRTGSAGPETAAW